jgi:hypothetical protein
VEATPAPKTALRRVLCLAEELRLALFHAQIP